MATSYDRVSLCICEHDFFGNYLGLLRARLETYKVQQVKFSMGDDASNIRVRVFAGYDGQNDMDWTQLDNSSWSITSFNVATANEVRQIAKDLWDRGMVPKYNCKWSRTDSGPKNQRFLERHIIDFVDLWLPTKLEAEMAAATERVRAQYSKVFESSYLESEKAKFVERTAVKEIKAALHKFRHLDESIIKTAFHEFVTEDVLSA